MPEALTELERPMPRTDEHERDRIDLRAERAWIARVIEQAERYGVSVSAYIRMAVSKQLELDEANPRPQTRGKGHRR